MQTNKIVYIQLKISYLVPMLSERFLTAGQHEGNSNVDENTIQINKKLSHKVDHNI